MLLSTAASQRCSYCLVRARRLQLQFDRQKSSARELLPPRSQPKEDGSYRSLVRPQFLRDRRSQTSDGPYPLIRRSDAGPRPLRTPDDRRTDLARRGNLVIRGKAASFEEELPKQLKQLHEEEKESRFILSLAKQREESAAKLFNRSWHTFSSTLQPRKKEDKTWGTRAEEHDPTLSRVYADLKRAHTSRGTKGLRQRLKFAFHDHLMSGQFSAYNLKMQKELADIRHPTEWYTSARVMQREIHLHVGPTNSGKTYQALKRLEQVKQNGAYAGPLRLLAHEVYARMNAKGIPTVLVTGDDRRGPNEEFREEDLKISACTVEMLPLKTSMEVCVIDEIQMIADRDRGWAWTQAVLGVRAEEVHLCGEERAVPLIEKLCAATGEKLHIHRYERLSPLKVAEKPLYGDLKRLEKGDCIVCFSIQAIHAMRKLVEEKTGAKVAIVYGSLPPETRAQQARLFNDPDSGYDYLVASDAIGMGLNLAVKRVIFESTTKHNGTSLVPLDIAHIKQIGGRAGRYRTAAQATESDTAINNAGNVGIVTTLDAIDFPLVKKAIESTPQPLTTIVISPTDAIVERFASYFPPDTPFAYILAKLYDLCVVGQDFRLCDPKDNLLTATLIEPVQDLTISQRHAICSCPAWRDDDDTFATLILAYTKLIAEHSEGTLTEIRELPLEILDEPEQSSRAYLKKLESLHKGLVLYLWLSYQFEGTLTARKLANYAKTLVEERIERALASLEYADRSLVLSQRRARERKAEALAARQDPQVMHKDLAALDAILVDKSIEGSLAPVNVVDDITAEAEEEQLAEYGDRSEPVLPEAEKEMPFDELGLLEEDVAAAKTERLQNSDYSDVKLDTSVEQITPVGEVQDSSSSFAAWRNRQTPGESQGSHDREEDEQYLKRVASSSA